MSFYAGLKVLVTGGTGLIGRPLTQMLTEQGARVSVVSLDDPRRAPAGVSFERADLRDFNTCLGACEGKDIVFHLAGVKGSPAVAASQPASFFVPMLMFNTNMMEAARRQGVERFLYTSSVGVYAQSEVFHEDDVWDSFPSRNDWFGGWAKRVGELQVQAYRIEYGWEKISVVRPANTYGPGDNFDPANAMVIPSLIKRAVDGESPLVAWGDGSPIRDFIYADDVALGMLLAVEKGVNEPLNLGSGTGMTIREVVEAVVSLVPGGPVEVIWDPTKPSGDAKRVMDISKAEVLLGFQPRVSLREGIGRTMRWYLKHREPASQRYNAFRSTDYEPRSSARRA